MLLAILVLCWFSPLETILIKTTRLELPTLIPMLIIAPPSLAAALAFLLQSIRKKACLNASVILMCAVVARQQATYKLQTMTDIFTLVNAVNALAIIVSTHVYTKSIINGKLKVVAAQITEELDDTLDAA